ncbi:hypothetical protein RCL1_000401 [Eukaryota sp. TZLM3-RCL]
MLPPLNLNPFAVKPVTLPNVKHLHFERKLNFVDGRKDLLVDTWIPSDQKPKQKRCQTTPISLPLPHITKTFYDAQLSHNFSLSFEQTLRFLQLVSKHNLSFPLVSDEFEPSFTIPELKNLFCKIIAQYKSFSNSDPQYKWLYSLVESFEFPVEVLRSQVLNDVTNAHILDRNIDITNTLTELKVISGLHLIGRSPADYVEIKQSNLIGQKSTVDVGLKDKIFGCLTNVVPVSQLSVTHLKPLTIEYSAESLERQSILKEKKKGELFMTSPDFPVFVGPPTPLPEKKIQANLAVSTTTLSELSALVASNAVVLPEPEDGLADSEAVFRVMAKEDMTVIPSFEPIVVDTFISIWELGIQTAIQENFNHKIGEKIQAANDQKMRLINRLKAAGIPAAELTSFASKRRTGDKEAGDKKKKKKS